MPTDAADPPVRRDGPGPALLLLLLVVFVHGRALAGDFLFDDRRFVVDNEAIASLDRPWRFFADPATADPTAPPDIYRPLRTLSFAVERAVFGDDPTGYHAVSLAWLALAAWLLFGLLRDLSVRRGAALFAAAWFAAHPAQVEASAWIAARADVMAGAFTLLALRAWVRCRGFDGWYLAALAASLLGALSKEAAVVSPGAFILIDLARPGGGGSVFERLRGRWRLYVVPALGAVVFAVFVRHLLVEARQMWIGHLLDWWGGSWDRNFALALLAAAYQALFVWFPFRPSVDWYLPVPGSLASPGPIAAAVVLFVIAGFALRAVLGGGAVARRTGAGVGIALLGGLVTSHVFFPVGIPTAERFLLGPLIGAAVVVAAGAERLLAVRPRPAAVVLGLVILGCGSLSFARVGVWQDEATLWREGPAGAYSPRAERQRIATEGNAAREHLRAAARLQRGGDAAAARAPLARAREGLEALLPPADRLNAFWQDAIGVPLDARLAAGIHRDLSAVAVREGDPEAALVEARAAVHLAPDDPGALHALAVALHALGREREAGWRMEEALALVPLPERGSPPDGRAPLSKAARAEAAAKLPPEDIATILNAAARGRIERRLPGAALRALRTSAERFPEARNPAVDLVGRLAGSVAQQREALEKAARSGDGAATVALVSWAGLAAEDRDAARAVFERRVGAAPETPLMRTLWALVTMEADDAEAGWRAALDWHRETLTRAANAPSARLGEARCLAALGRKEEAQQRIADLRLIVGLPPEVLREAALLEARLRE